MASVYCNAAQVAQYALNAIALSSAPAGAVDAACIAASEILDSHFRGRFPLPLLTWGTDVVLMASFIAGYLVYTGSRGAQPMKGADDSIERNYDRAMDWARGVQRQTIHPDVTFTPAPETYRLPQVSSPNRDRGWGSGGIF